MHWHRIASHSTLGIGPIRESIRWAEQPLHEEKRRWLHLLQTSAENLQFVRQKRVSLVRKIALVPLAGVLGTKSVRDIQDSHSPNRMIGRRNTADQQAAVARRLLNTWDMHAEPTSTHLNAAGGASLGIRQAAGHNRAKSAPSMSLGTIRRPRPVPPIKKTHTTSYILHGKKRNWCQNSTAFSGGRGMTKLLQTMKADLCRKTPVFHKTGPACHFENDSISFPAAESGKSGSLVGNIPYSSSLCELEPADSRGVLRCW